MNDTWTIQTALEWTQGYLERKGDENPRLSAQWLLAEATGLSRIELYAQFNKPLSKEERELLRGFVSRRGEGEPLQYITGEVGFRHITIKVEPGVLIPRPETEVLVSEALATLPSLKKAYEEEDGHKTASQCLIADICTGSGCIACSLAYEYPASQVIATDIDPVAVELTRKNAEACGVLDRVQALECDLGEGIPSSYMGTFDLVVSNPPYIPSAELASLPGEVSDFEPARALDGGADGLDVFRKIATWSAAALKPGGSLAVELHETCLDEAARIAECLGFKNPRIVDDLAGRPRVLIAMKP